MAGQTVPLPIDPEALREARASVPPNEILTMVVEAFQALADPTRARILYALMQRPLCVRDLALLAGVWLSTAKVAWGSPRAHMNPLGKRGARCTLGALVGSCT